MRIWWHVSALPLIANKVLNASWQSWEPYRWNGIFCNWLRLAKYAKKKKRFSDPFKNGSETPQVRLQSPHAATKSSKEVPFNTQIQTAGIKSCLLLLLHGQDVEALAWLTSAAKPSQHSSAVRCSRLHTVPFPPPTTEFSVFAIYSP